MIDIHFNNTPYEIAIEGTDIVFQVRPLTLNDMCICRASAQRLTDDILKSSEDCRAAGLSLQGIFDPENPDHRNGLYQSFLIREIAVSCITGWRGVMAGDQEASATPDNIRAVFNGRHIIADRFFTEVTLHHRRLADEKKPSGAAPPGTSAAAPLSVKDAEKKDHPAPPESAGAAESAAPISSIV